MKKIDKNKISEIIFILIIVACSYILINSAIYLINSNRKYSLYDKTKISEIKTNMKALEDNIDKISKLDNSVYTKEELDKINKDLRTIYKDLEKSYEIITTNKKYSLKEISKFTQSTQFSTNNFIKIIKIIKTKDTPYKEMADYMRCSEIKNFYVGSHLLSEYDLILYKPYLFPYKKSYYNSIFSNYINSTKNFTNIILKVGEHGEK